MSSGTDIPIGELFTQLVDDGKRYAHAEVALYKAKLTDSIVPLRTAAALGFAAIMLVQAAVGALLIGLILWLAPALGPMGSTLTVFVGALVVAALLGFMAYRVVQGRNGAEDVKK